MTFPLRGALSLLVFGAIGLNSSARQAAAADGSHHPPDVQALVRTAETTLQRGVNTEGPATVLAAVEIFRKCAQLEPSAAVRWYELARAEYALESLFEQKSDPPSTRLWLARALEDAQHATTTDDRFADAHTLLADLYGTRIGLEGVWAAIRFGARADAEAKTALKLAPDNPRVQLTIGRRFLYSPRLFGGRPSRPFAVRSSSRRNPTRRDAGSRLPC